MNSYKLMTKMKTPLKYKNQKYIFAIKKRINSSNL